MKNRDAENEQEIGKPCYLQYNGLVDKKNENFYIFCSGKNIFMTWKMEYSMFKSCPQVLCALLVQNGWNKFGTCC